MRRSLAILAVVSMLAVFPGCGDGSGSESPAATTAAGTAPSTTEATTTTITATTTTMSTTTTTTMTPTTTTTTIPMVDAASLIDSTLPVSGELSSDGVAPAVQMLADFMSDHGVTAGVLAVSRDGVLLASVGIGWLDADESEPVLADTPMRIASISKPITLATFRIAAEEFGIAWDDFAWCVPGGPDNCWLDIEPALGDFAEGIGDVTIRDLAYHKGGWDRYATPDPMFESIMISDALGLDRPPEAVEVAAYMASQPLDFLPGSRSEYSNFGYLLLGLVIEEAAQMDLVEYMSQTVFAVAGNQDVYLGATLPEERNPREPAYHCSGNGRNVFDPDSWVCWPDGGWYLEAMEAHGGLVMTAPALIGFLDNYCIDGKPHPPNLACGEWLFFGSLDGTLSAARQLPDGTNYAVILNRRAGVEADDLSAAMDEAMGAITP